MIHSIVPVAYSTLTCEGLIDSVLSHYDLGTITHCQFWNRGLSDVYLVETPDTPYILRVSHSHWRSRDEVLFELEWLDFLREVGLPVAYPLRTQDKQLAIEIDAPEGKRYASVFIYAPGHIPIGDLNIRQSQILGEIVAKLHYVAPQFHPQAHRPDLSLDYLLHDSIAAIIPFLQDHLEHIHYLVETGEQLTQALYHLPKEPPFWSICWGDPHSGNVHFDGDRATLFDFDQCGYGWRIFEIAKFFQVALCTGIGYTIRNAFLDGYQSIQPLTPVELDTLQSFTQVAHIWRWAISLNHAVRHEFSRLDHRYFSHRIEQLKMLQSQDWQLF